MSEILIVFACCVLFGIALFGMLYFARRMEQTLLVDGWAHARSCLGFVAAVTACAILMRFVP